ncbi:hypothetical protein Lal_00017411 [Lupinus albus]|nr:hypothetical protein Lal_00017411 [Lupinus albus]
MLGANKNIDITTVDDDDALQREAKKEAFRKYLESSGAVDALTKVLVSLYEQNDKPSSALQFIQNKLSCPSISEHEKLQAELSDLQIRYNELLTAHQTTCKEKLSRRKNVTLTSLSL